MNPLSYNMLLGPLEVFCLDGLPVLLWPLGVIPQLLVHLGCFNSLVCMCFLCYLTHFSIKVSCAFLAIRASTCLATLALWASCAPSASCSSIAYCTSSTSWTTIKAEYNF